jgi:hypothetical protein
MKFAGQLKHALFFRIISCPVEPGVYINPLMLELNPYAQCCLMRFFTGDFAS